MHYDFVLRDVDPRLGRYLPALADLLSEHGERDEMPQGFPDEALPRDDYLEAVQELARGAVYFLPHITRPAAEFPSDLELRFFDQWSDLGETARRLLSHAPDDQFVTGEEEALHVMAALLRRSDRERFTPENQAEALLLLLDRVRSAFQAEREGNLAALQKACVSLEACQTDLRALAPRTEECV